MEKGKLLATGRTAEVFAWGEDRVLKLYKEGWPELSAQYEHQLAKMSQETGYAVPAVFELVEVEGRHGIVYERVDGIDMMTAFNQKPWTLFSVAKTIAEIHVDMHTRTAPDMPDWTETLMERIPRANWVDERTMEITLKRLEELPKGDKLMHGDFHPGNILKTPSGPIIIDWIDAKSGHPLADVARTYVLTTMAYIPADSLGNRLLILGHDQFANKYLKHYFKHSSYTEAEMRRWLLPIAVDRLNENIVAEEANLRALIEEEVGA